MVPSTPCNQLWIKLDPDIGGFVFNGIEFKLIQFADRATVIVDGTQHSLQSALNTIEIFGNFSGLEMNKEKRKVVWLGRKSASKDKLKVRLYTFGYWILNKFNSYARNYLSQGNTENSG